jgi:hypothetical protein
VHSILISVTSWRRPNSQFRAWDNDALWVSGTSLPVHLRRPILVESIHIFPQRRFSAGGAIPTTLLRHYLGL